MPRPAPGPGRRATQEDNVLSHHAQTAHRAVAPNPAMTGLFPDMTSEDLLAHILASLEDDKAEEITTIDLRGKSSMADYMVVCSGRSTRQVSAISDKLRDRLKQDFGRTVRLEGKEQGDWVLIDAGDIIVHVFRPEVREFYQIEKMWMTPDNVTART
ncbi:ribosome silencing factor [Rhodovulum bhavnagarense]